MTKPQASNPHPPVPPGSPGSPGSPGDSHWASWSGAASEQQITRQLGQWLTDLDGAVEQKGPTCWTSGQCCHFDRYGHRLYVTGLEIAWVLAQVHTPTNGPWASGDSAHQPVSLPQLNQLSDNTPPADACPYQIDKLCSIHQARPMGCRVFFCQGGTQDWQQLLYETYQRKICLLHERHNVVYEYMEWRAGLQQGAKHLATYPLA